MIQGVLLAGGAGLRFGTNKLLHPLPGGGCIAAAAAHNLVCGLPRCLAVVRPGDDVLARQLRQEGLEVSYCPESVHGLGHSIACGVAASAGAGGWILALADMPYICSSTIAAVAEAVARGAAVAVVEYGGRRGHPVGFGAQLRAELLELRGDNGARSLIERHAADVVRIATDDPGVLQDIDRPADVAGLSGHGDDPAR